MYSCAETMASETSYPVDQAVLSAIRTLSDQTSGLTEAETEADSLGQGVPGKPSPRKSESKAPGQTLLTPQRPARPEAAQDSGATVASTKRKRRKLEREFSDSESSNSGSESEDGTGRKTAAQGQPGKMPFKGYLQLVNFCCKVAATAQMRADQLVGERPVSRFVDVEALTSDEARWRAFMTPVMLGAYSQVVSEIADRNWRPDMEVVKDHTDTDVFAAHRIAVHIMDGPHFARFIGLTIAYSQQGTVAVWARKEAMQWVFAGLQKERSYFAATSTL